MLYRKTLEMSLWKSFFFSGRLLVLILSVKFWMSWEFFKVSRFTSLENFLFITGTPETVASEI